MGFERLGAVGVELDARSLLDSTRVTRGARRPRRRPRHWLQLSLVCPHMFGGASFSDYREEKFLCFLRGGNSSYGRRHECVFASGSFPDRRSSPRSAFASQLS